MCTVEEAVETSMDLDAMQRCLITLREAAETATVKATPPYAWAALRDFVSELPFAERFELEPLANTIMQYGDRYEHLPLCVHGLYCELSRRIEPYRKGDNPPPMVVIDWWVPFEFASSDYVQQLSAGIRRLFASPGDFIDLKVTSEELVVYTPPITLTCDATGASEYFPGFEVRFDLRALANFTAEARMDRVIRVTAEHENQPADGGYIHPHVEDGGGVCFGEAYEQLLVLLQAGMVDEAAHTMLTMLRTYNSESPYVALDEWQGGGGTICSECGETYDSEDEGSCCSRCDVELCSDCDVICADCGDTFCHHHRTRLSSGDYLCSSCLTHCDNCNEPCFDSDLTDGVCQSCLDDMPRCSDCDTREGVGDDGYCDECREANAPAESDF